MRKVSFIFAYRSSGGRQGGWSETWYRDGTQAEVDAAADRLAKRRVGLLPGSIDIVGWRNQLVGGRGAVVMRGNPGNIGGENQQDIPQMALFCSAKASGQQNVKHFFLRGIVDAWVVGGDFTLVAGAGPKIDQFWDSLHGDQWRFRGQLFGAATAEIAGIDATGNMTLLGNFAAVVNNKVSLLRVRNVDGKAVKGTYTIETRTDDQHFKLRNYTGGVVGTRGKVRLVSYDYFTMERASMDVLHVGVRKIGRPFASYHGRRTRR